MIGIKGQGMTALAGVLVMEGARVTGSDTEEVFTTDAILKELSIEVRAGFAPANIPEDTDLIVYSTAYSRERNPELAAALDGKIPVVSYPEALGMLSAEKMTLAVSGTHGKTTTTALLGDVLRVAGLDPTAIVGSQIGTWKGNALAGKGPHLVIEADEYQNKLRYYQPFGVVLTSVDWDHPDFFPTPADYEKVFADFVARIPRHGFLVACGDSAAVKKVGQGTKAQTLFYGFLPDNDIRIVNFSPIPPDVEEGRRGFLQTFSLEMNGEKFGPFMLRLSGEHNAQNATAVFAVAQILKLPPEAVATAFQNFPGTKRRFERIGEKNGVVIYDDYAHHPDEIQVTLHAFRGLFPARKIRVIFHPHTFTRTKALLQEFAQSFEDASEVAILPIYGSAREEQGGVSSEELVALINRYTPGKATHAPSREKLIEEIRATMKAGDVIVTMGAGDVWHIAEELVKK
ncbi:MAG: UDP-N-acetylmuramate--L-alanine ligase [Candidatus Moraniibacteriota bacterium]